jgi:hypothetical protein
MVIFMCRNHLTQVRGHVAACVESVCGLVSIDNLKNVSKNTLAPKERQSLCA